jgi:hypothetical protein
MAGFFLFLGQLYRLPLPIFLPAYASAKKDFRSSRAA